MIVDVVYSHPDRLPVGLLTGVGACAGRLIDQQMIEPLGIPVVPGCVGTDALMPASEGVQGAGEVPCPVVGFIICHDSVGPYDAMGGEEGSGPGIEAGCGHRFLGFEGLGVG